MMDVFDVARNVGSNAKAVENRIRFALHESRSHLVDGKWWDEDSSTSFSLDVEKTRQREDVEPSNLQETWLRNVVQREATSAVPLKRPDDPPNQATIETHNLTHLLAPDHSRHGYWVRWSSDALGLEPRQFHGEVNSLVCGQVGRQRKRD